MIVKPTVLVLGAGASQPYPVPVGSELADKASMQTLDADLNSDFRVEMRTLGVPDQLFPRFRAAFKESGCISLDEFVQAKQNRAYLPLVRALIVRTLVGYERPRELFPDVPEHTQRRKRNLPACDWFQYLFRQMLTADHEEFGGNQLRVITFNFDRSFEYRLFLALRAAYRPDGCCGRLAGHRSSRDPRTWESWRTCVARRAPA